MAKTSTTSKQVKKQPTDCHCDETKTGTKAKTTKSAKNCSNCK